MDALGTALDALAASAGTQPPLNRRLELVVDSHMDAVLRALAQELVGEGDPSKYRSKAARALLLEGALAMRAKQETRA